MISPTRDMPSMGRHSHSSCVLSSKRRYRWNTAPLTGQTNLVWVLTRQAPNERLWRKGRAAGTVARMWAYRVEAMRTRVGGEGRSRPPRMLEVVRSLFQPTQLMSVMVSSSSPSGVSCSAP